MNIWEIEIFSRLFLDLRIRMSLHYSGLACPSQEFEVEGRTGAGVMWESLNMGCQHFLASLTWGPSPLLEVAHFAFSAVWAGFVNLLKDLGLLSPALRGLEALLPLCFLSQSSADQVFHKPAGGFPDPPSHLASQLTNNFTASQSLTVCCVQ